MKKAISILGGMGPGASSYMYDTLIKLSIKEFGAKNNNDFPEIILHSIPIPDFISNDRSKEKALEMLKSRVKQVNKLNISCVSIACNTAHILLEQLQKESKVPFISIIDEMVKQIKEDDVEIVGLVGTPAILKSNLYQTELKAEGIKCIIPTISQIKILEKIIRDVIAGKLLKEDERELIKIANYLKSKGAKAIALGCTELPLVFPKKYSIPVYNSVEVLSKALLLIYYEGNTIQKG